MPQMKVFIVRFVRRKTIGPIIQRIMKISMSTTYNGDDGDYLVMWIVMLKMHLKCLREGIKEGQEISMSLSELIPNCTYNEEKDKNDKPITKNPEEVFFTVS